MAAKLHGPNDARQHVFPCADTPGTTKLCRIYDKVSLWRYLVHFASIPDMRPKTEAFLNFLLWSTDKLVNPTFRNLTDSYESWAYRNGMWRQVAQLEDGRLVERNSAAAADRMYRLTRQGRLHVLGGRDPQTQWSRKWDGRWRLVLFDVPTTRNTFRDKLRRYLRDRGFGCLQNSVWITPDALKAERQILGDGKVDVGSLLLLEARPCAGESDEEIVAEAWDFEGINRCYARYLKVLGDKPAGALVSEMAAKTLLRWAAAEREAWLNAVKGDPLLPERILPDGYLGQRAWRRRVEVLRETGQHLRTFKPRWV